MKNYKLWAVVIGAFFIFLFVRGGGWISYRLNMLNGGDSIDTKDKEHFEPIITSIAEKDASSLLNMFSLNVQESNPKLNDDIRKLFEFISEDIIDWDVTSLHSFEDVHRGKKKIQYQYPLRISTVTHTYIIWVTEQTKNDLEHSSVGLLSLEAYDKANPDVIVRIPVEE